MGDFKFANEVTVRFAETDAQGIAHHAAYLVWFETTRIEYLRRFRGGYLELRNEGIDALTLEAYARYTDAARFDDRLTIRARCSDVRGARFRFDYAVERDGIQVADGWTTHACVSVGRPPPDARSVLARRGDRGSGSLGADSAAPTIRTYELRSCVVGTDRSKQHDYKRPLLRLRLSGRRGGGGTGFFFGSFGSGTGSGFVP